jgi:glycosyltransferase involved in cell wall biosynthesis
MTQKIPNPKVSVIIPAYNVSQFLVEALDSLQRQTYKDFEVLVIDDGSSDDTYDIARRHPISMLRLIRHEENMGVAAARNTGIKWARGEYIALLDGDDIAFPTRLERQVCALDADPSLAMVGSQVKVINESGSEVRVTWRRPVDAEETAFQLIFRNPFITSALMFRARCVPVDGYRSFIVSEDYDFNARVASRGRVKNLDEVLVSYRVRKGSLTHRMSDAMEERDREIMKSYLLQWGIHPTEYQLVLNQIIGNCDHVRREYSDELLNDIESWLLMLCAMSGRFDKARQSVFENVCKSGWLMVCSGAAKRGSWLVKRYFRSPLAFRFWAHKRELIRFLIKTSVRHKPGRRSDIYETHPI